LVRRGGVVPVAVGDEPRHDVVEVLPVRSPVVKGDRVELSDQTTLLIDAAGPEVLRLVVLDRVLGGGVLDGRGRGRGRGRCATAFSRQPHLGLSGRADLTVSLKPIRPLPCLNSLHRANANLPINVGAHSLLHGGMTKVALRLEAVTGRAVYEVPVLAIP